MNASNHNRPSVLFLCHNLPYPPDSGGKIRSFHLLKHLSAVFRVSALCLFHPGVSDLSPNEAVRGLEKLGLSAEAIPVSPRAGRFRFAWDHIRSVIRQKAYTLYSYQSKAFQTRLPAMAHSDQVGLVHVDSLDLVRYLPQLTRLPLICGHHNVESALLARRAEAETSHLRRRYLRMQSTLLMREERRWASQVTLNLTCSEEDSSLLQAISPNAKTLVVPNGIDVPDHLSRATPGRGILFVGGADWHPNLDAMEFFARSIAPKVREQRPDVPMTWVGQAPEALRERFQTEHGIQMPGHVPDVLPYLDQAACLVVPLRVGGGTRIKILEGWAAGKPVVSTSIGCEGLGATDGVDILIRDEAEGFAKAVLGILEDPKSWNSLGDNGRIRARSQFDWAVVCEPMIRTYGEIIRRSQKGGQNT